MGISGFTKFGKMSPMKSIRGATPPVAIDFGVRSLKALQLTGGETPSLTAAAQLDTPQELLADPAGRLRYQIETLPKIIRSGGFTSNRAVFSLPAGQMFCKHLQLQRIDGVRLDEMVSATIAQQMECDAKALVVRHAEVRDISPGKAEIVCFASARQLVEQLMLAVKNAKLNPVGIHTEIHALLRGAGVGIGSADAPVVAHLDLGHGSTKVVVARGEEILFARIVSFGGLKLDQSVVKQTQLSLEKAHAKRCELKSFAANTAPAAVAQPAGGESEDFDFAYQKPTVTSFDLSEPIEIFVDELRMCLRYHRALSPQDTVERIVFTGGEARHEALCAHIAQALRLPAQVADPMSCVGRSGKEPVSGLSLTEAQPGWAVAMGLATSPTDL